MRFYFLTDTIVPIDRYFSGDTIFLPIDIHLPAVDNLRKTTRSDYL